MILRPLQKLGGDSKTPVSTVATPFGDGEFNSYVSYFLTLKKKIYIFQYLFAHTSLGFFYPLTLVGDEWEGGRLHSGLNLLEFIPPTHNRCHCL